MSIEKLNPREHIIIKGAKVNNLKNIDVAIPRNKLVVITGLSGSGKSSLAFDTLFAEGQRLYVESLSAYARQFLGKMEKPDVEYIKGVAPAIAVEQKGNSKNPRATVGTTTEIYDYLKLLYARVGITYSPESGNVVRKDSITDVIDYLNSFEEEQKVIISAPIQVQEGRTLQDELKIIFQKGFSRIFLRPNEILEIEEFLSFNMTDSPQMYLLIDRASIQKDSEENQYRLADSIQTAFYEGFGACRIDVVNGKEESPLTPKGGKKDDKKEKEIITKTFSDKFEMDNILFEEPSVQFFSFNNPYGACKTCGGLGNTVTYSEKLIIPDESLSVFEGCVACWKGEKLQEWRKAFVYGTRSFDFPVHRAYQDLTDQEKHLLWHGHKPSNTQGIWDFFAYVEKEAPIKIQYRVIASRFKGKVICPDCKGTRLRKDAQYVKIGGQISKEIVKEIDGKIIKEIVKETQKCSLTDLVLMPIDELFEFFENINLSAHQYDIGKRILSEINQRLKYLHKVGLGYLTLNRLTSSLSGGEFQRIKLATALGSALVGSMYILDEPSIGLHPRDTAKLVEVLKELRDLGNTVIVVEHEEEMMRHADQIIDIGLEAGLAGGNLVFQGNWEDIENIKENKFFENEKSKNKITGKQNDSLAHFYQQGGQSFTIDFLTKKTHIKRPERVRDWRDFIYIEGAKANNLKNISTKIPLDIFTVITGVSGSGKSTLIKNILYPAVARALGQGSPQETIEYKEVSGSIKRLQRIELIDQNPINRSSRSNPLTFTGAYDSVRSIFASTELAKSRDFAGGHFSFNSQLGMCDTCKGDGYITIEMQFMADIHLNCETCKGKRFKKEVLEVLYKEKTISDVLDMTVYEALTFFADKPAIIRCMEPLDKVGLGYVRLGQSTSTLSGGEAQRLKLAEFLQNRGINERTLFIFDEPTTGLHFHDITKLVNALQLLVAKGHTVIVIEHNMDVIQCADWVIDLGKEGGKLGGHITFEGTPKQLAIQENNYTAQYLKEKFI